MAPLAKPPTSEENLKLIKIIEDYNALRNDETPIQRLFYLQKIHDLVQQARPNTELLDWYNKSGPSSLEAHLQHYGVHRDASALLQSIEFANAVQRYAPASKAPHLDFFSASRQRDALFKAEIQNNTFEDYVHCSQDIMIAYDADQKLQEKGSRSIHFLALSYAKIEAIKGLVTQEFDEYQIKS